MPESPPRDEYALKRKKRTTRILIVAAILVSIMLSLTTWQSLNEKKFAIDRAEVKAYIHEDGKLVVYEAFDYRFEGSFNGTTRALPASGYEKILSFDAYLVEPGLRLDGRPEDESIPALKQLETTLQYEDGLPVFRAYSAAENESLTVVYRYVLQDVVHRENGTALLDWSFFDRDNQSDIRDLKIAVVLPRAENPDRVSIFLEDRYGGTLRSNDGRKIVYANKMQPKYKESRLHLRFPAELVPNAPEGRALPDAKELTLQERYELRNSLPDSSTVVPRFAVAATVLALLLGVLPPFLQRLRPGFKRLSLEEMIDTDPLLIAYIKHSSLPREGDVAAGLLSLYRKGALDIVGPKRRGSGGASVLQSRLRRANERQALSPSERFLLDWLVPASPEGPVTFNSIAGLSLFERHSASRLKHGQEMYKRHFRPGFLQWIELVREEETLRNEVRPNRLFIPLALASVWANVALALYVLTVSAMSTGWTVWGALFAVVVGAACTACCMFDKNHGTLGVRTGLFFSGMTPAAFLFFSDEPHSFLLAGIWAAAAIFWGVLLPGGYPSARAAKIRSGMRRSLRRLKRTAEERQQWPPERGEALACWLIAAGAPSLHAYRYRSRVPTKPVLLRYGHEDDAFPLSRDLDGTMRAFRSFNERIGYPAVPIPSGSSSGSSHGSSGGGGGGGAGAF